MQHLTTYRTSGWPTARPQTWKEMPMDPLLAKVLVDASVPVPPDRGGVPRRPRTARLRPQIATVMRRIADRLDTPEPRPATCH
jgi:hypothetical protein